VFAFRYLVSTMDTLPCPREDEINGERAVWLTIPEAMVSEKSFREPILPLLLGDRGVMPYWGWIGLLLSLTAMAGGAWYFIEFGNPLFLLVSLVAGLLAYRLSRTDLCRLQGCPSLAVDPKFEGPVRTAWDDHVAEFRVEPR